MSKDTFKENPNLQEYFETSDGTAFYKEDHAKDHARNLEDKTVKTVTKDQEDEPENSRETAKDILAKVPAMDLTTAEEYLDAENDEEFPRKTVVAAITKRITELEDSTDLGNAGTGAGAEDENENSEA